MLTVSHSPPVCPPWDAPSLSGITGGILFDLAAGLAKVVCPRVRIKRFDSARMRRLRRSIRRNDVFRWADAFFRAALAEGVSVSSPARKLRLVAGTIGDLHRFAGPDMAIRPSGRH